LSSILHTAQKFGAGAIARGRYAPAKNQNSSQMLNPKHWVPLLVVATLTGAGAAAQQSPIAMGTPPGWNAAMIRLFGDIKAFSAKAELRVLDKSGKETITLPMTFALLDRKVRMDIEMTQMKGPQVPPEQVAGLKQMAMDRLACIVLPDTQMMKIIFPALAAYVEMPLPTEETTALKKNFKIDKAPLGQETIDGHPCVKNRVTMTDEQGQNLEFIVWSAGDLKDFPLQAQVNDAGANVVILYKNVQFARPDAKQFDAPAGYTRHTGFVELMEAAALRQGTKTSKKK